MIILSTIALLLLVKTISILLDIASLSLKLTKTQSVNIIPNEKEKKYQFIKGLY